MWAFGAVEGINLTAYSTICHTLTCYNDTQQNIPLENTSKYNFTLMYPPAKSKKIKLPEFLAGCLNNKGSVKNNLGDYLEAIKNFDKAIRLKPELEAVWNNRGIAKSQLGRYKEAITDFDKAIRLNPELAEVWYNKVIALRESEKLK